MEIWALDTRACHCTASHTLAFREQALEIALRKQNGIWFFDQQLFLHSC